MSRITSAGDALLHRTTTPPPYKGVVQVVQWCKRPYSCGFHTSARSGGAKVVQGDAKCSRWKLLTLGSVLGKSASTGHSERSNR